jgi:hypothetical protein
MFDDMRERVWARYSHQLQELLAEQQQHPVFVTIIRGHVIPTSNGLGRLTPHHRSQRPSCCSIKTAILPSRPAFAHAGARSVLDGREHDGILIAETGGLSHALNQPVTRPLFQQNELAAGCARIFTAANTPSKGMS